MRKLLGVVTAVLLLIGVPAAAQSISSTRPTPGRANAPVAAPGLERALAAAHGAPSVVFVHGVDLATAQSAAVASGLRPIKDFRTVAVVAAVGLPDQVREVTTRPGVVHVEPDRSLAPLLDTAKKATRADEAISRTYDVTDTTGKNCDKNGVAEAVRKNCRTTTTSYGPFDGAGRSIAVIDTGIDGTHPMFQVDADGDPATAGTASKVIRNLRVTCPITSAELGVPEAEVCGDTTAQSVTMAEVPTNDSDSPRLGGHGTHVASIAAGVAATTKDGRRVEGVAPGAKLIALSVGVYESVLGSGTALDWVVENHAHPCGADVVAADCPPITVVNNSYGAAGEFDEESVTAKLQRQLASEGVVMVWANGNDGGNGSVNESNIDAQDQTPGILAVANYNDLDRGARDATLAPSSSRGEYRRKETYPDISAPGTTITAACRRQLPICSANPDDPDFGTISGTSMAAPHVAGAVAVLQEALEAAGKPADPATIEHLLEDTAHRFDFAGPYESDPTNPTTPTSFDKGHGLLDLTAAVATGVGATSTSTTPPKVCSAGTPTIVDPAGDGVVTATGETPDDDPALDLLSAELVGDATAHSVTLSMKVRDLEELAGASRGDRYVASFWAGAAGHSIDVQRLPGDGLPLRFNPVVDGSAVDADVSADVANDILLVTVPAAAFSPALSGAQTADGFSIDTLSATAVVVGLYADSAATECPGVIDTGVVPPPTVDETADGNLVPGGTYSWEGTPPLPVNPVADPTGDFLGVGVPQDLPCFFEDDPRCDTERIFIDLAGAAQRHLHITLDFPEGEDFDAYLYDAAGRLVATAATGDPQEVFDLDVKTGGTYRVAVSGFTTTGTSYQGTATLS